jgi:general secretion pathway protein I
MRKTSQAGFTLLEVLVAFTIFALSFAAILQVYSQRLQSVRVSDGYGIALGFAESMLARAGIENELAPGSQEGELDSGLHWRQSISRYGSDRTGEPKGVPYLIDVEVTWNGNGGVRRVQLTTLRLSTSQ